jgi:hypothetical protein
MYLLYLDDSGSVANPGEEYFVLGGVCVPENSVRWLSYEVEKLAERLNPTDPAQIEFHAAEIFSGRKGSVWGTLDRDKRRGVLKDVLLTLRGANRDIVLFACAVHKASFPAEDPVKLAFEDLSSRFDLHLQRVSSGTYQERGMIVLDDSSYETSLQGLARSFRQQGNRWGSYLKGICEVPLFVDSRASRLIQLADHIAYAVFRRYNAGDLTYFNCVEGRFDQEGGTMHGLAHRTRSSPDCTCSACITRRLARVPQPDV